MSNNEENFFDELGAEKTEKTVADARAEKLDHLIHKTFAQNPAGAELLETWTMTSLVMTPTADINMGLLEIGIREGRKSFIRDILLVIKRVEDS